MNYLFWGLCALSAAMLYFAWRIYRSSGKPRKVSRTESLPVRRPPVLRLVRSDQPSAAPEGEIDFSKALPELRERAGSLWTRAQDLQALESRRNNLAGVQAAFDAVSGINDAKDAIQLCAEFFMKKEIGRAADAREKAVLLLDGVERLLQERGSRPDETANRRPTVS